MRSTSSYELAILLLQISVKIVLSIKVEKNILLNNYSDGC